jgi:crotonobetainyl-CoA:carnitine CoA-transferase CaiB-like acyl-CoA transferase
VPEPTKVPRSAAQLEAPRGPLTGVRVIDLTSYLAGPYGCALLGDLGADVIKVEPPAGDMMRSYPTTLVGDSRAYIGANKNKRGIVVDLKHPEGHALLCRFAANADVLVHNFRPNVPPRLGIDYETLRPLNSRLIYCGLTGYGETGPLRDAAGFDQVLQSWTGIATFQGAEQGSPQVVRGSIVDYYASALLAMSVNAALYERERTGEGQYVGLSLLRTALVMQAGRFVWAKGEPREVDRDLQPGRLAGIHPTRDGFIYVSAHSPHFWKALCEALELPDLASDPRYDNIRKRAELADELLPRIRTALKRRNTSEWVAIMQDRVPAAAVRPLEDLFDDPQAIAEEMIAVVPHPSLGEYRTVAKPATFSRTPGPPPRHAPSLGEHTDEILDEFGLSSADVGRLRKAGAVK